MWSICNGILVSLKGNKLMLWTIVVVLVGLWLLGLIGNIGGALIHILLVLAVVVVAFNLLNGRRSSI